MAALAYQSGSIALQLCNLQVDDIIGDLVIKLNKITVYLISAVLLAGSYTLPVQAADEPFSMVIFPRRNVKITYRLFKPMASYLSRELGRDVRLVTPRDFKSFWRILTQGDFDLVHLNQYHFVIAHDKYGHEAILKNVEFGSATMRGIIAVRKDSRIESLQDLKGKKILFGGGRRAMISYQVPTWLLRNAGLREGDYEEVFAKNPPNAYISVYNKRADAAGVGNVAQRLNIVKNTVDISKMKVLAEGPELPQLVWAVKNTMQPGLSKKIQTILSNLSSHAEGQAILDKAQLTDIALASKEEYEPYRQIIQHVQPNDLNGHKN